MEDQDYFEKRVIQTVRATQIPAISFALMKNEQLKRAVAFGYANPLTKEAATVTTKFRMGSISKVVTSAAIFSLIDQGTLPVQVNNIPSFFSYPLQICPQLEQLYF